MAQQQPIAMTVHITQKKLRITACCRAKSSRGSTVISIAVHVVHENNVAKENCQGPTRPNERLLSSVDGCKVSGVVQRETWNPASRAINVGRRNMMAKRENVPADSA